METAEQMIARLSAMSPEQLAVEKIRLTAQHDARDIERYGYALNATVSGRKPIADEFVRVDSASKLKAHTTRDQSGRPITTYTGPAGSIREWTEPYRSTGFYQDAIFNGDQAGFERAGEERRSRREAALRGIK